MSIIGEFHQYGSVLRHACRDRRIENMMNGLPRELQVELGWIDGVTHHGSGAAGQLHKYGRVAMLIDALPIDIQIELGWPVGPLAPATNVIQFARPKARCA